MPIALIIPIYNQADNWSSIVSGINNQTVLPDIVYVMLDRASNEDIIKITDISKSSPICDRIKIITNIPPPLYIGNPTKDSKCPLFLTGHIRNYGIELALTDGCDIFIFIDGDCIPQNGLIESHTKKLGNPLPVLSIGRRREKSINWRDSRETDQNLMHINLFRESGILVNNSALFENSMVVWSCNIGLNLKTVQLLKKFNSIYYGRSEVFCSEFLGSWGGEDGFMGIQALYCRIFVTTVGEKNAGVQHIDHPRPTNTHNIEHMTFFKEHCQKLRRKVTITPMNLQFFTV